MKRLFLLLFALLPMLVSTQCSTSNPAQNSTSDSAQCSTSNNNVIRYTTSDNKVLNKKDICNANLISNTYADRQGIMVFNKPITEIGDNAFQDCISLKSITIPNSVTKIGWGAFHNCTSLESITIPHSVTSIATWAFNGCSSLKSITIPDSVTDIELEVFSGCTSLKSIKIGNSVTKIWKSAFSGCTSLTSITIPDSITSIGEHAFFGCTSLKSITIPSSVTEIEKGAFCCCESLPVIDGIRYADTYLVEAADRTRSSYLIKKGTRFIGDGAFSNCTSLTNITIPESVTSIGDVAFGECTSLKSVYCKPTTPPTLYPLWYPFEKLYTFDNNASGRKIYVPRASVEAYKTAEGWKEHANNIVGYDF